MPNNLENFWGLLELRYDCSAIMVEWEQALGDALPHLQRQYLMPLDKFATFYPNPRNPQGTAFDVIAYKDGTFEAISNNREHSIPLKPEDVLFHRWNLPLFRNHIARCLDMEPPIDTVNVGDRVIRLGHNSISPGEEFPVYWLLINSYMDFQREVPRLMFKNTMPFFLLTGTRDVWDPTLQGILKDRNVPLLPLCEALEFHDGQFVPTDVWHGAMEAFRKTLHPENMVVVPEYQFALKGDWDICFAGTRAVFSNELLGLRYIQHLLKYPNQKIHVKQLEAEIHGKAAPTRSMVSQQHDDVSDEFFNFLNNDFLLDDEGKLELQNRLKFLAGERRKATDTNNSVYLSEIDAEFAEIEAALSGANNIHGHQKKLDRSDLQLRDRISKNLKIAISKIGDKIPEFAQYLENTIRKGYEMSYCPSNLIDWKFV